MLCFDPCLFQEKGRTLCKPMLQRARTVCEPVLQNARESLLQGCYSFPNDGSNMRYDSASWSLEKRQALQQADNLKWQQEMFHRILKMMGLCQEGLVDKAELKLFRLKLLDRVTSLHADGEWADFTRDKLLFLQDLLYSRCISEEDYHEAKRPLLLRLAEQGAVIDSNDVLLSCSAQRVTITRPSRPATRTRSSEEAFTENFDTDNTADAEIVPEKKLHRHGRKRSAMRLFAKAVSKFRPRKQLPQDHKAQHPVEVAETIERSDSRNPEDCPDRDAPVPPQMRYGSPHLPSPTWIYNPFCDDTALPDLRECVSSERDCLEESEPLPNGPASPPSYYDTPERSASPAQAEAFSSSPPRTSPPSASSASSSKRLKLSNLITDFICKIRGDQPSDGKSSVSKHEDSQVQDEELSSRNRQRLGRLRHSKMLHNEDSFDSEDGDDHLNTSSDSIPHGLQGKRDSNEVPDIVKWKRRVLAKHASSNPFTEKIVEENIKRELLRIRAEMSRTNTEVTFTDDQIDAIATRLPVDKAELLRFFPRSWCDSYGDIVLAVVEREYQGHVDQRERFRRARKEEQTCSVIENDEHNPCPMTENDEDNDIQGHDVTYDNILIERMWNKISMARCYPAVDENIMQTTILSH
ncbi:hypothetical protein O6H91_16G083500 [Diphasiastrum complanatum]|uniref:Uncharacterized protein n=1 Tax=Diphasiastrum complanatum TaxID=34168 RepID=A0ACC2BE44_DIPCM|nr:hypothetical protein O6H91_16G083500 [Diphasiastrum complanatum]